eukprot:scaffold97_cov261-Pinguiococcus_pyrenoidosus.AAC.28
MGPWAIASALPEIGNGTRPKRALSRFPAHTKLAQLQLRPLLRHEARRPIRWPYIRTRTAKA